MNPTLADQLTSLCDQLDQPTEQLAETLAELSEQCQEAELSGMGDLLALISELVTAEEEGLTPEHQAALGMILGAPGKQMSLGDLLTASASILTADIWQAPLETDDIEALPELLEEDWPRLLADSTSDEKAEVEATETPDTDIEPEISEAVVETETASDADDMLDVTVSDQTEESWASDTPSQLSGPVTQALQQADGPEALSEQLADLSESLAEQDPPLISDLFALASEQIASLESLDIEILPALASQLDQLLDTPDHRCTSTALGTLGNDAWPEPLDSEDLAEQQALIDEAFLTDSASAELDLALEPVEEPVLTLEMEPELEIDQEQNLASSPISDTDDVTDATDAIAPTGPATSALAACAEPDALSELLAELSEALVEREPTLLSDLVALAAELCGSLESLDGDALPALMTQLDRLLEQPSHEAATQALAMLGDSSWPVPLEPEDQEGLQELINAEFLAADTADDLEQVVEVTAAEPDDLIGPAVNALQSAQTGAELSEQLLELSEAMAEMAPTLISDLFALAGEGSEALDDLNTPIVSVLCQQLDLLLQNPTVESATQVLSLLSDSNWPAPLDPEDAEELQSLVSESFAQPTNDAETFIETDTEASTQAPEQAEPEAQVPEVALALPSFCEVDMSLLEQAGPKVDPQILAMLSATLLQLTQLWEQTEPNSNSALLAASQEALLPLERACGTVHLNGIRTVLEGLGRNLEYLEQRQQPLEVFEHTHFTHCLEALQAHLADLGDKGNRDQLVDAISDTGLPAHADPQQSAFITGLLALAGIQAPEDIEHPQATAEDIELSIADDIDPQLLEMLYDELPTLVDEFQQHLQAVLDEQQTDSLLSAQRAAHTIKGLANMAGIRGLAKLTHCMEDVLEVLTDAKTLPGPQLAEDLTEATDCLAQMSESISEAEPAPDGSLEVLQNMMDWFYRLRTEGIEAAGQALTGKKKRTPKAAPAVTKDEQPSEQKQAAQGGSEQGQLRVPVSLLDNLFRIAGESSTLNAQLDDRLNQMHRLARANRERQRILQKVMFDIEQQLQDYFTLHPTEGSDDSHFDPLEMDRYHSMHTTLSQLQEAVADVREVGREMADHIRHLDEMHASQTNLQKESLDNVLNTRLVPVKTLSSRMQRIMRQACRAAGKEANLVIEGEGVLIDSQVLGQLADPLMHIIRNAVDHGLEAADVRAESGKDETGTLTISFRQAQNQVQVSCSDDGGGINVTRVKEIAERKGLLKGGRVLSDNEAQRLILIPGFSTRDEVSQLSGRGIGMDVVYQQVTRLQGTISIHSVQGEGTRFDLALPASSLLVHTLLVRSANKRIHALSSHTIEQSLLSADGELTTTDDGMTFTTDEGTYPAYTLETLLGEKPGDYTGKRLFPILLVKLDQGEKAAVLVPEVLAHREQVFKSMGEHLPDIPGVPGVTILADGSVAPIVDLQGRIRQRHSALSPVSELAEPEFNLHLPEVLVVDDSLSARKTLATLLSDSGYEVRTAIDGLDALDKIRQEPPAIVLTDLEMPRMSGMELAAILRNSKQYNNIPVVMITSRSTHKHRGEAEAAGVSAYLTKPWTETQVLDQVQKLLF